MYTRLARPSWSGTPRAQRLRDKDFLINAVQHHVIHWDPPNTFDADILDEAWTQSDHEWSL